MNKTLGSLFSLLALSGVASAEVVPGAVPWTGFYVGAQVGAAANVSDFICEGACISLLVDTSLNNILAGGYAGYNFKRNRLVFGVEGDFNKTFGKTGFSFDFGDVDAAEHGYMISQDYYASIRARLGVLVTDDLLAYATGGWAWTNYDMNNPGCPVCSDDLTTHFINGGRDAPVFGAGLEYAVSPNVHLKGEYLYADFGSDLVDTGDLESTNSLVNHQFRIGMSWNF